MSASPERGVGLDAAWRSLDAGRVDEALEVVAGAFERIGAWASGAQRLPIGWPEADRLIAAAVENLRASGASLPECAAQAGSCDAVLISRWSQIGGHAAVAADLLRASSATDKRVFVIHGSRHVRTPEAIAARLGLAPGAVELCPPGATDTPWEWLPQRLAACGCTRLFIFHETRRPGVLAAALASAAARKFVVHHVDSKPCSGLFLPGVPVIELTPFGWHYSRAHLGIDPVYLPLVSRPPAGERPAFLSSGELRTATCGRAAKFDSRHSFRYPEIIAERLRRFGGRHVHIGPLSAGGRATIDRELERRGVPPERFEYISSVPNLPDALWAQRIDLYLASFPFGGARTIVDVMASATPAVVHVRSAHSRLGSTSLSCQGTSFWSDPGELWEILRHADAAGLAARSRQAREHFERCHRPALLAEALALPDCGDLQPPPLGPADRLPEPQDVLCQLLADLTGFREREARILERLTALEAATRLRAARSWWRRWFGA